MIPRYCGKSNHIGPRDGCSSADFSLADKLQGVYKQTNLPDFYKKSIGMDMPGMKTKEKEVESAYRGYTSTPVDALYLILGKQQDPRKSPDNPQKALYAASSKMALSPDGNYVMQ